MKTLVLYTSNIGSTKRYAEDIAAKTGGDVFPLKEFKWRTIKDYDIVVYGGWIMGGTIKGADKFFQHYDKSLSDKDVIIFSSGMTFPTAEGRHLLISQNLLDMYHVRYYQLRGSFDFSKLKFPYNFLMNNSLRMIEKNPESSEDQKALLDIKNTPIEYYDSQKIEKIVSVIKAIESAPKVVEVDSKDK
jgi:menaquinone-dependent protoporphyrinogen IX oxidase